MAIKINGNTVIDDSQNVTSTGAVSATGNVTGGNIKTSGVISAGGNINSSGSISATGNIYGSNIFANITGNIDAAGANTQVQFADTGDILGASANFTFDKSTNTLTVTNGNVVGGNLISNGNISASGNIAVGFVSASGNITGVVIHGNVIGNVQAAGNTFQLQYKGPDGYMSANASLFYDIGNLNLNSFRFHAGNGGFGCPPSVSTLYIGNVNPTAIHMGGDATSILIGNAAGNTQFAGNVSVIGNIIPGSAILSSGLISTSGNVAAGIVKAANLENTGTLTISSTSDSILIQPAGNIILANTVINGLGAPLQNSDAATKAYVDQVATTGLTFHQAVFAATTSNLATATGGTITYTQPNGASNGIGAKITTTGSFNLIDTANVQTVGTRILVKNEANAVLNGVYTYANSTSIVRATDADEYGADSSETISINDYFFVQSGTTNAGSAFVVSAPTGTITFGTSNIEFTQFSSSQTYTANTLAGISIIGTVFNIEVDQVTTSFDLGGNVIVKPGALLTTPNIGVATGTSLSTTGNVTGGNILTAGIISVAGDLTCASNIGTGNLAVARQIIGNGNIIGANLRASGILSVAGNATVGNLTITGNITDNGPLTVATSLNGNITLSPNGTGVVLVTSNVSASGNITGNYIFGNGSQLTGIDATSIQNGTANVRTFLNGNVTTSAGGVANVFNVTSTGTITTGTESVTGTVTGGNIATAGFVTATGTVTGGNIATAGTVSATGTVTGGNLATAGTVSATGNITGGNLSVGTGDVTAGNIRGFGLILSGVGNITGGNISVTGGITANAGGITAVSGNVSGTNLFSQSAISAGGTIQGANLNISATGNITGGNVLASGAVSATGNVTGGNILYGTGVVSGTGNVFATNISATGTIYADTAIQSFGNTFTRYEVRAGGPLAFNGIFNAYANTQSGPQVQILGNVGSVSAVGNITGGNISTAGNLQTQGVFATGFVSASGNILGGNLSISATGNITGGNVLVTGIVSSTGNAIHGNVNTAGAISATGNIIGGNLIGGGFTLNSNVISSLAANITIDPLGTGNVDGNVIIAGNLVVQGTTTTINSNTVVTNDLVYQLANNAATSTAASGAGLAVGPIGAEYAKWLYSSTQSNWTTALGISATGTITGGNVLTAGIMSSTGNATHGNMSVGTGTVTVGNIVNANGNGVGNIGSSSLYFNTVFAKATSAQYADLAEKYTADANYEPGTVVMFGGSAEVTQCVADGCSRVAGVISTNPSYIMNGTLDGENVAVVALTGRVPTKVSGSVRKGDLMVSAGNGRARAEANPRVGTVIGKALADSEGDAVIEVVVGRF